MFIKRLEFTSDVEQIKTDLNNIVGQIGWGWTNQIGLKHRPGVEDIWFDSVGSLYNRATGEWLRRETDFTEWSVELEQYTRQQVEQLAKIENFVPGRVRYMKLPPKCGLSVHKDLEVRYHLVLDTNQAALFVQGISAATEDSDLPSVAVGYNIPRDGHWYRVDTTQTHTVYNGGDADRIHLVVCGS